MWFLYTVDQLQKFARFHFRIINSELGIEECKAVHMDWHLTCRVVTWNQVTTLYFFMFFLYFSDFHQHSYSSVSSHRPTLFYLFYGTYTSLFRFLHLSLNPTSHHITSHQEISWQWYFAPFYVHFISFSLRDDIYRGKGGEQIFVHDCTWCLCYIYNLNIYDTSCKT